MNSILLTSCLIFIAIFSMQSHLSCALQTTNSKDDGINHANSQKEQQQQHSQQQQSNSQNVKTQNPPHNAKSQQQQQQQPQQQQNDAKSRGPKPQSETTQSYPSTRSKRESSNDHFIVVDNNPGYFEEVPDAFDDTYSRLNSVYGADETKGLSSTDNLYALGNDAGELSKPKSFDDVLKSINSVPTDSDSLLTQSNLSPESLQVMNYVRNLPDQNNDNSETAKRAREFFGKRSREFFGKRSREFFGKRSREFFGKRSPDLADKRSREFFGKRAREFFGKRNNEDRLNEIRDNLIRNVQTNLNNHGMTEGLADEDGLVTNKRAREFFGKRAREFFGKRAPQEVLDGSLEDSAISKRPREFFGKRSREFFGKRSGDEMDSKRAREFFGKRAREFFGKRSGNEAASKIQRELLEKRAREFFGKRSREFFGKRSGDEATPKRAREFFGKRAREFFGKRSGFDLEKRPREFFGKRQSQYSFDKGFGSHDDGLTYAESNGYPLSAFEPEIDNIGNVFFHTLDSSQDSSDEPIESEVSNDVFDSQVGKRAREFFGKRSSSDNSAALVKRPREFFGKRSSDDGFGNYISDEMLDQNELGIK